MGLLFGGLALICAALPGGAALLGWSTESRHADTRFALLATMAAFLVAAAGILALPVWIVPTYVAAVALGLLLIGAVARDLRLEPGAWTLTGISVLLLALDQTVLAEVLDACGRTSGHLSIATAVPRWAGLAAMLAACAWQGRVRIAADTAQVVAVLAAYVAIAQLTPIAALPLLSSGGLVLLAGWSRTLREDRVLPAAMTCVGIALMWAAEPLLVWAAPALRSLAGSPILVPSLPLLQDCLLRLLLPAVVIAATFAFARVGREARIGATVVAAMLGGIALHALYLHGFGPESDAAFVRSGLAERTLWEALLLGVALLFWHFGARNARLRPIAIGFGVAALAHSAWYSLVLHNPLWTQQATGSLPLLNGLLLAYALPLLVLWLADRAMPDLVRRQDRARSITQMVLILLLGVSELRQAFHGSLLVVPGVTASEDVLRSVGAIVAAVAFLLWGIRRVSQEWRIGSLVLMLAAVGKVFLIDAAGLDGLLRIASFGALGFSLIGIGWLYSRYLKADPPLTAHQ